MPAFYSLVQCEKCHGALLAEQWIASQDDDGAWRYGAPHRAFPNPDPRIPFAVPLTVAASLREAHRALNAGLFLATALLCRRTIEAYCHHEGSTEWGLEKKLDGLLARGRIDARLHEWAHALKNEGDGAAHVFTTTFSEQDAREAIQFAEAFVQHVYVLTPTFEAYKARRPSNAPQRIAKASKKPPTGGASP